MTRSQVTRRAVVVLAASLLLAVAFSSDAVVQAGGRGHRPGLTGTWFVSLPQGLTGFYTYNGDGTMTGVVSTIFGAPPWPGGEPTLASSDRGQWRRVRHGFKGVVFRIIYDQVSGNPVLIVRIRTSFAFDGRNKTSGTFLVDEWDCPAITDPMFFDPCPDPNTTPPDRADIEPPFPFNTFVQTRVRMPRWNH